MLKLFFLVKPNPCLVLNTVRYKTNTDISKVPNLNEKDLEEQFVRGSGPGGQAINKTSSCVVLRHVPTGIIIKCQETRLLDKNRRIARSLLINKLDNLINGESSVQNQIKAIQSKKSLERNRRRNKLNDLKNEWLQREGKITEK